MSWADNFLYRNNKLICKKCGGTDLDTTNPDRISEMRIYCKKCNPQCKLKAKRQEAKK